MVLAGVLWGAIALHPAAWAENPYKIPLTQKQAKERRAQLGEEISYRIKMDVTSEGEVPGELELSFDYRGGSAKTLRLDYTGAFDELVINGVAVDARSLKREGVSYLIPVKYLKAGQRNQIQAKYRSRYSQYAVGIYRFKDAADGNSFVYTFSEPCNTPDEFPVFDQPDLKAKFTFSVVTDASWEVITNTQPSRVHKDQKTKFRTWEFAETQRMSPYLFAFAAGPFERYVPATQTQGRLFHGIYVRPSVAAHLDTNLWFKAGVAGLSILTELMGVEHPFGKLSFVLVPNLMSVVAMENPGVHLFNESYFISRSPESLRDMVEKWGVMFHELAHLWWGDTITPVWWEDLWINEAFASYLSYLALEKGAKALGIVDPWRTFYLWDAAWALPEDRRPTAHPVGANIADSNEANAHFDGITYGKGSAILRQLAFRLGEEKFLKAIGLFIKQNFLGNVTRNDFLGFLRSHFNSDAEALRVIQVWEKDWLLSRGANEVRVHLKTKKGVIQSLELVQAPDLQEGALREHAAVVALYDWKEDGKTLVRRDERQVIYSGARTAIAASGEKAPAFVYPNFGAYDYVSVTFGKRDLDFLREHLSSLPDGTTRVMIWHNLYEMVQTARLPAQDYIDMAFNLLPQEQDYELLTWGLYYTWCSLQYLAPSLLEAYLLRYEAHVYENYLKSAPNSNEQAIYLGELVWIARSPEKLRFLTRLLEGKEQVPGWGGELSTDFMWSLVTTLAANQVKGAGKRIHDLLQTDRTDIGVMSALAAHLVHQNRPASQSELLKQIFSPSTSAEEIQERFNLPAFRLAMLTEAMAYMHWGSRPADLQSVKNHYGALGEALGQSWEGAANEDHVSASMGLLAPRAPCAHALKAHAKMIAQVDGVVSPGTRKGLADVRADLSEMKRAQEFSRRTALRRSQR